MDDYYAGALGARRLLRELDHFLQHVLDSVDRAESMTCAIELQIESGERVRLDKTYRAVGADEEPDRAS